MFYFLGKNKMSKLYEGTEQASNIFELLKQMQNHLIHFKTLEEFMLPKPICLQNEYTINMFYLNNKWPEEFPDLEKIEKSIKGGRKLFYVPEQDYYYVYYHLLIAYKNFLKSGKKEICDDKTLLDYDIASEYLIRKNLNGTKFFEVYLEKGRDFTDLDLVHAIDFSDLDLVHDNLKLNEKIPVEKMTTEFEEISFEQPTPEPEIVEVPKTISPLPPTENEIENYPETKVKLTDDNFF